MGRWSPQVLPEAPRALPALDIGGALDELAGGISRRRGRNESRRLEEKADSRYRENQARDIADKALAQQRQGELDEQNKKDRQARRESEFVTTRGRAMDDGFIGDGQRQQRRSGYAGIEAGGGAMGGAMGAGVQGIGHALLDATDDAPSLSLTRPDDSTESLHYDPTQTREARTEADLERRARLKAELTPPPRDRVTESLEEYEGKLKLDKQYGAGAFKPTATRGGGRGAGLASNKEEITIANTLADNARADVGLLERQEPKAPKFDLWRGGDAPIPGQKDYPAFQKDSTATANAFASQHGAWEGRMNDQLKKASKWNSIADSLATDAMNLRGGQAVQGTNQMAAQRELLAEQRTLNAALSQIDPRDTRAKDELQRAYFERVTAINSKYGIRPTPED